MLTQITSRTSGLLSILLATAIISTMGCQNGANQEPLDLSAINLLRGDLITCGDAEYGEVKVPFTCSYEARETFNLAFTMLHSFEYEEAEKAFVKVIDMDPNCAMAYWGVAMCNFHALWLQSGTAHLEKGSQILEAANSIKKPVKEDDYIQAISAYYSDWETMSRNERIQRFEQKMEVLYQKYAEDQEAAIFYALSLVATADPADKTYKNQLKAGEILESIYPNQPNHPGITHYLIHTYDNPELANLALQSARNYAKIAPASAHAQHMPSHIFTRLGLWEESIASNQQSASSALCYVESIDPEAHSGEEVHAMAYLVYAYLQIGEEGKAKAQYDYLKTFKKIHPESGAISYPAAAMPSRIALETRNWEEAANLEFPPIEIDWENNPWQKAILHFARGLGAARSGNTKLAGDELVTLQSLRENLLDQEDAYKANQVHIQIKTVEAWLRFAEGKNEEAVILMREAADMEYNTAKHPITPGEVLPAGELLGDLLLAMNKPQEALEAYEFDLQQHPNRFNGLYGAGTAAKRMGDVKKAQEYFSLLLQLTEGSNTQRKEVRQAQDYVNSIQG